MTRLARRRLGTDGPEVSELCLGTMMFGDQTDASAAREIVVRFAAAGGNFIDTADTYSGGDSERMLGPILADLPGDWIVTTKVGNKVGSKAGAKIGQKVGQKVGQKIGQKIGAKIGVKS